MIAALKGAYPDLENPLRDALVASLANLSVAEPRSVVDTAIAFFRRSMLGLKHDNNISTLPADAETVDVDW